MTGTLQRKEHFKRIGNARIYLQEKGFVLGIYQFSSAPQSGGRGRQDRINLTMRRSPRVNQEVLPRATFLG
jgi:hypothetical protein